VRLSLHRQLHLHLALDEMYIRVGTCENLLCPSSIQAEHVLASIFGEEHAAHLGLELSVSSHAIDLNEFRINEFDIDDIRLSWKKRKNNFQRGPYEQQLASARRIRASEFKILMLIW
jgi:hypothetical protein